MTVPPRTISRSSACECVSTQISRRHRRARMRCCHGALPTPDARDEDAPTCQLNIRSSDERKSLAAHYDAGPDRGEERPPMSDRECSGDASVCGPAIDYGGRRRRKTSYPLTRLHRQLAAPGSTARRLAGWPNRVCRAADGGRSVDGYQSLGATAQSRRPGAMGVLSADSGSGWAHGGGCRVGTAGLRAKRAGCVLLDQR